MNVKKMISNPFFFISALIIVYYGWDELMVLSKSGEEKAKAIKDAQATQGAGISGGAFFPNMEEPVPTYPVKSTGAGTSNILTSIIDAILPPPTVQPTQTAQAIKSVPPPPTVSGAGITFPAVEQPVPPAPAVVAIPAVVQPPTVAPAFTRISGGIIF